jgi:hypothetical protein
MMFRIFLIFTLTATVSVIADPESAGKVAHLSWDGEEDASESVIRRVSQRRWG